MERFYNPEHGQVFLDNVDIAKLDLRSYRQAIGYVGQEPVLFNCSIRDNMLFARPDAPESEIIEALKASNAWDFIQKMDKGLDTMVGGSGGSLSGGQK